MNRHPSPLWSTIPGLLSLAVFAAAMWAVLEVAS